MASHREDACNAYKQQKAQSRTIKKLLQNNKKKTGSSVEKWAKDLKGQHTKEQVSVSTWKGAQLCLSPGKFEWKPQRDAKYLKLRMPVLSVDCDVEQLEASHPAGGTNCYTHFGKQFDINWSWRCVFPMTQ